MNEIKSTKAINNCYVIALLYGALCALILILRNQQFTDRFTFMYAGNALGMTFLFLSFPFAFRKENSGALALSVLFRVMSMVCFLVTLVWLVSITFKWYEKELIFEFNMKGLFIYFAGLALTFILMFTKTTRLGKGFQEATARLNKLSIRNFITASVILAYLQISLLFNIDFITQLIGIAAFAIIMADQAVHITKRFITTPKH